MGFQPPCGGDAVLETAGQPGFGHAPDGLKGGRHVVGVHEGGVAAGQPLGSVPASVPGSRRADGRHHAAIIGAGGASLGTVPQAVALGRACRHLAFSMSFSSRSRASLWRNSASARSRSVAVRVRSATSRIRTSSLPDQARTTAWLTYRDHRPGGLARSPGMLTNDRALRLSSAAAAAAVRSSSRTSGIEMNSPRFRLSMNDP